MTVMLNGETDGNICHEAKAHPRVPWFMKDPLTEYQFSAELGSGRYGTTYQIKRKSDGLEFACKVINKLQRHCQFKDVMREVDIQRRLIDSHYVCKLYEVWEWQNYIYLVEELCRGGELFDVIISRGHLSERDAAAVVKVILQVVRDCHLNGILHRDLKPENFLLRHHVDPSGPLVATDLRAIDFGLSVLLEPGQRRKEMAGSSYYLAPEVIARNYGHMCDLWSAGVIAYILLTGQPPFWGNTDHDIYERIRYQPLDLRVEPLPDLSPVVKDFLKRLLNRDETQRMGWKEALSHPWITTNTSQPGLPLSRVVFTRLRRFTATTKLKHLLMHVVAQHLTDEAIGNLKFMFQRLDRDSSGSVSYDEFEAALRESGMDLDRQQIQELLQRLDLSQVGRLDYSSFVAAAIDKKRVLTDRTLATIFAELDLDGDGLLGVDELQAAAKEAGIEIDSDMLQDLMVKEGPGDRTGLISPQAFQQLMSSIIAEDLGPAALDGFLTGCRRFSRGCHFRQLALHVVASHLEPDALTDLHDLFTAMDVDGCGRVTFKQLQEALEEAGAKMAEEELTVLFDALDIDHDGLLQYTDFLAAALEHQAFLTEARIRAAFEFFDGNGDGVISLKELRSALRELLMDPDGAEAMLAEADTNHDRVIDFGEFHTLLTSGPPSLRMSASLRLSTCLSRSTAPPSPVGMSPQPSFTAGIRTSAGGVPLLASNSSSIQMAGSFALRSGLLSFPGRPGSFAAASNSFSRAGRGAGVTLASPAGREAFLDALRRKNVMGQSEGMQALPSLPNGSSSFKQPPTFTAMGFNPPPLSHAAHNAQMSSSVHRQQRSSGDSPQSDAQPPQTDAGQRAKENVTPTDARGPDVKGPLTAQRTPGTPPATPMSANGGGSSTHGGSAMLQAEFGPTGHLVYMRQLSDRESSLNSSAAAMATDSSLASLRGFIDQSGAMAMSVNPSMASLRSMYRSQPGSQASLLLNDQRSTAMAAATEGVSTEVRGNASQLTGAMCPAAVPVSLVDQRLGPKGPPTGVPLNGAQHSAVEITSKDSLRASAFAAPSCDRMPFDSGTGLSCSQVPQQMLQRGQSGPVSGGSRNGRGRGRMSLDGTAICALRSVSGRAGSGALAAFGDTLGQPKTGTNGNSAVLQALGTSSTEPYGDRQQQDAAKQPVGGDGSYVTRQPRRSFEDPSKSTRLVTESVPIPHARKSAQRSIACRGAQDSQVDTAADNVEVQRGIGEFANYSQGEAGLLPVIDLVCNIDEQWQNSCMRQVS